MEQYVAHALEVEVAIHPIEDGTAQEQRQRNVDYVFCAVLHVFLSVLFNRKVKYIHPNDKI